MRGTAQGHGFSVHEASSHKILHCGADGLKERNLIVRLASSFEPCEYLADFSEDISGGNGVTGLAASSLLTVDIEPCHSKEVVVEFAPLRPDGSHGIDVGTG